VRSTRPAERWKSDDLMACLGVALIVSIVVLVKILIGVLSVPVVVLMWLYDLGSRSIKAANSFKNPEHEN
jgi:hypothetical protein